MQPLKLALSISAILATSVVSANNHTADSWEIILAGQRPYPAPTVQELSTLPEGYELITTNFMGRHGSRYDIEPNLVPKFADQFRKIISSGKVTPEGRELLAHVNDYSNWWKENPSRLGLLTDEGFKEQEALGKRMAYLADVKKGDTINVVTNTSDARRAMQSRDSFIDGFTQEAQKRGAEVDVDNQNSDTAARALNPHHYSWFYRGEMLPKANEYRQTVVGKLVASPPKNLSDIISPYVTDISLKDAGKLTVSLQELCMQDAPQGYKMGLCEPFKAMSAQEGGQAVLNWLANIQNQNKFYIFGPANLFEGVNNKLGHIVVNDFLTQTEKAILEPEKAPKLNLRFGHDSGNAIMQIALGLIGSEGSDEERLKSWEAWKHSVMSTNTSWQLLKKDNSDNYFVRLLQNEKVVSFPVPGCEKQSLCSWDTVKNYYSQEHYAATGERIPTA